MNFLRNNSNKLTCNLLSLAVLGALAFGSTNLFFADKTLLSNVQPNGIRVDKIDDNHAKIHCDSIKTTNSDFLFNKSEVCSGNFQYNITDLSGSEKLYEFSSPVDISINEGLSSNAQLNVAIVTAAQGAGTIATVGAVGAAASAVPAAITTATVVGNAVAMGATTVTTLGAFGPGFMLGVGIAGAALGPITILAGAGALVGAG